MASVGRRLIVIVAMTGLSACGHKAGGDSPPQNPSTVSTSPDAGLPVVPLSRRGVIVPSDVKLETSPNEMPPLPGGPSPASAPPGGN
jgi:hypothetical protein